MKYFCFFILYFAPITAFIHRNNEDGSFSAMFNKVRLGKLDGLLLATINNIVYLECLRRCARYAKCTSVNFNENNQECELMEDSSGMVVYSNGWLSLSTADQENYSLVERTTEKEATTTEAATIRSTEEITTTTKVATCSYDEICETHICEDVSLPTWICPCTYIKDCVKNQVARKLINMAIDAATEIIGSSLALEENPHRNAIDGNVETFSSTKQETDPFLTILLTDVAWIVRIKILFGFTAEGGPFKVFVDSNEISTQHYYTEGSVKIINTSVFGRNCTIQSYAQDDHLDIYEAEIYGHPYTPKPDEEPPSREELII